MVWPRLSPRRQKHILKKGFDKWDPFQVPKDPIDIRTDKTKRTTQQLVREFLQMRSGEAENNSYNRGVLELDPVTLHNTLQTRATEMAPEARGTGLSVFAFSLFTGQAAGVQLAAAGIRSAGYRWTFTGAGLLLLATGFWFSGRLASRTKEA